MSQALYSRRGNLYFAVVNIALATSKSSVGFLSFIDPPLGGFANPPSGGSINDKNPTELLDVANAMFTTAKYRLPRLEYKAWDNLYFQLGPKTFSIINISVNLNL